MFWEIENSKRRTLSSRRGQLSHRQSAPTASKLQALWIHRGSSKKSVLRCGSILVVSTIVATLLFHLPSFLLEMAFFPAHGLLFPNAISDFTPSIDYVGDAAQEQTASTTSKQPFPRILHVTYKTEEELPEEWKASLEDWRKIHPNWEVNFWSDVDIEKFVREHYPDYVDMFHRYRYTIQRVDAVRYMILNKYGGLYSDLDIYPARSLDLMLEQFEDRGNNVILAKTKNAGVTNAFMASAPQSAFMGCVVENLPRYQRRFYHMIGWRHWEVLSSAGSTFLWGMVGHCRDDGVGVLSSESFRSCSVCDSWKRHSSSPPLGDDGCDTEWLRHSSTNSSWHETKSLLHTMRFACAMFLFCNPFRACFVLALSIVIVARYAIERRRRRRQNRRERLPLTVEETAPLRGALGPWIEMT